VVVELLKRPDRNSMLLVTRKFPPGKGGVQNYLYNTVMNFRRISTTVLCPKTHDPQSRKYDATLTVDGHMVFRTPLLSEDPGSVFSLTYLQTLFNLFLCIRNKAKKENFDFILFGHVNFFFLTLSFLMIKIERIPCGLLFHGEDIPAVYLKSNILMRYMIRQAALFLCNSKFTQKRLIGFMRKDMKCIIAYPGVRDKFFEQPESRFDAKEFSEAIDFKKRRFIYTLSRLDKRKGHDLVLKALTQIHSTGLKVNYLIGGRGENEDELKNKVKTYGLEEFVKFVGIVSEEKVVGFHKAGAIFVMPNRTLKDGDTEGFGIAFLEANAVENPVIGGRAGGAVEAVLEGVTGYLVDPFNVDELVDRITFLLKSTEQSELMGKKGRNRAWEEFRWPYLTEKLEKEIMNFLTENEK
jgi:phosphatidyl-myo-inositol dimannoside synthase